MDRKWLEWAQKLQAIAQSGTPTESFETEAVAFFGEYELPPLSLTRVVPTQISRLFEHYRNPDWQTDFD